MTALSCSCSVDGVALCIITRVVHLGITIRADRSCGVAVVVVVITINTLVAQAVDRTQSIADLYTVVIGEVARLISLSAIQSLQNQGIHFLYLIEVLSDVTTQLH